jgi:hypothetical protein
MILALSIINKATDKFIIIGHLFDSILELIELDNLFELEENE